MKNKLMTAGMLMLAAAPAMAATDITEVVTEVGTYKTSAIAVGIAILLYVIGRRVVRKLI